MARYVRSLITLRYILCFLATMFFSTLSWGEGEAQRKSDEAAQRRLLGLIEYLAADYPGAVANGKIVSDSEFAEMKDFARTAAELFSKLQSELKVTDHADAISESLQRLNECVAKLCSHDNVLSITDPLKKDLIQGFAISAAPSRLPDLKLARETYMIRCASCHGVEGKGDGPLSASLEPKPRSFLDDSSLDFSSPLMFFDTLQNGVSGTSMPSFAGILTQDEMWSLSFYLLGLRFAPKRNDTDYLSQAENLWQQHRDEKTVLAKVNLAFLALQSDKDLRDWMQNNSPKISKEQMDQVLAYLRAFAPFASQIPLSAIAGQSSWELIQSKIQEAKKHFDAGLFVEAEGVLLDAYLQGFEREEAKLAVADHSLLLTVERAFLVSRGFANKKDERFHSSLVELENLVAKAQTLLEQKKDAKGQWNGGEFFSSLIIILREGFEAFLIILALLMIIKNMQNTKQARYASIWIHAGWIAAVVLGLITYFLFEKILMLSGSARESVEAFCTGIAAIVLFYTGFWLLSQSEHSRWQAFIKAKTSQAFSTKRLWLLSGIAFIAVFREAAETVLFYAALLSSARSSLMVALGFGSGLGLLFVICVAILKFNVRIPMKKFFLATSLFMMLLSVILVGKATHEFIAAGYLRASPMSSVPMIDVLGIYPLEQTLFAQLGVVLLAVGLSFFFVRSKQGRV